MNKLSKTPKDRMIFGVCGGIGRYLSIDSSLIRIAFVIGTILTGSLLFWIYVLMAIVLPTQE